MEEHGYEQHSHVFFVLKNKKESVIMQKSKLQSLIFTIVMAFFMVYGMICYNIALNIGGMTNQVFLMAFHELVIMWPVAIILELFIVEKLSLKLTLRCVDQNASKLSFTIVMCSMIVCLMCPMMSFVATVLFKNAGKEIIAVWLQTTVFNFPMALAWQIFFVGPLVRNMFKMN